MNTTISPYIFDTPSVSTLIVYEQQAVLPVCFVITLLVVVGTTVRGLYFKDDIDYRKEYLLLACGVLFTAIEYLLRW